MPSGSPRPPRRVSLRGKGADIFFGDYTPPGLAAPEPAAGRPEPGEAGGAPPASATEAETTGRSGVQPDLQAGMQEATLVGKPTGVLAGKKASMQEDDRSERRGAGSVARPAGAAGEVAALPEVADDVWESLDTPATITNSFRYTDTELEALTDVLYQIGKQQGAKLSKQDVARLGLNLVLDDYQRRGASSLLGQLAGRRRRPRPARGG